MRFFELAELLGDPVEIFNLEFLLAEGVTLIGVETGGNAEEVGVEFFQVGQCRAGGFAPAINGGVGRDGVGERVVSSTQRANQFPIAK